MNGESWFINPQTRDYQMDSDGSPVKDNSLKTPIYVRTMGRRTQWLYAPDDQWGSDFYAIKNQKVNAQPLVLVATEQRALQPLLDDGRAVSIDVQCTKFVRGAAQLQVVAIDATGQVEPVTLDPIY